MPAKKASPKGKTVAANRAAKKRFSELPPHEWVKLADLHEWPDNPNEGGNHDAIAESLEENDQFQPVIVQKSTMYILSGNQTCMTAIEEGYEEIQAILLDIDDAAATKIVLAANRTGDLRRYNSALLAINVEKLGGDVAGTGYTRHEAQAILDSVKPNSDVDLAAMLAPPSFDEPHGSFGDDFGSSDVPTLDDMDDEDAEEVASGRKPRPKNELDGDELERASDETSGILQLKDEYTFDFAPNVPWGIPALREDRLMLPDEIPTGLKTWGGSASKEDPDRETAWWFYNFGIDSTSGMYDKSRMILSFYAFDEYFETFWWNPAKNVTKMLNTGVKYAVTPNFSMWHEHGPAVWMWSLYRSRWLGRYFQEAGIRIIPDICWTDNEMWWLKDYVLDSLPTKVPVISLQLQTMNPKKATKDELKSVEADLRQIVKQTRCDVLICYADHHQRDWVDTLNLGPSILHLQNRYSILGNKADKKAKADDSNEEL